MPTSQVVIRPLAAPELDGLVANDEIAFNVEPHSEQARAAYTALLDLERTIGAFDGDALVGGASMFDFQLCVPGALIPMAAVSWVSVLPTHRRRGVLTAMMRHQLHGLHEQGGPAIAGLTASEPAIYGRFGYGQASWTMSMTVQRHRNALRLPPGPDGVTLRMVPSQHEDTLATCTAIYHRRVPERPGMLILTPAWERFDHIEVDQFRGDRSHLRTVLAERDGEAIGYARYRTKTASEHGVPAGRIEVHSVYADDIAGYSALLRYLLDIDLNTFTDFTRIPVDSPLLYLLADVRAAAPRLSDSLFLRLVELDQALAARTYVTPVDLVLEVTDDLCPWNAGTWRLSGDEKGAACERTQAPAELALDVRDLGAAFLGGMPLRALQAAGLVEERRPGAVAEASRAFHSDVAPWLPVVF
ncbi:MAG TPA: GNAT family N-acetyltransferase [Actinocrinis sp.]|jgi:predicted acetyltransferase